MRERLDHKQTGDRIHHEEYNLMADVVNRVAGSSAWLHTQSIQADAPSHPSYQAVVEITNDLVSDADTANSGLYLCKLRVWDSVARGWFNRDTERVLDATGLDLVLGVGHRITAWWSEQRG